MEICLSSFRFSDWKLAVGVLNLKKTVPHFFSKMILSKASVKKSTVYIFYYILSRFSTSPTHTHTYTYIHTYYIIRNKLNDNMI